MKRITDATRSRSRNLAWMALAEVLGVLVLAPGWIRPTLSRDEVQRGHFIHEASRVSVRLEEDSAGDYSAPTGFGLAPTRFEVLPGDSASVSLRQGQAILVEGEPDALPPYAVIGRRVRIPDVPRGAGRFVEGQIMTTGDGSLVALPWHPEHPWTRDEAWLLSLRASCATPGTNRLEVAREDLSSLTVAYGQCRGRIALPPDPQENPVAVLVVGASEVYRVWKKPGIERSLDISLSALGTVAVVSAAQVTLLWLGLGVGGTVLTMGLLLVAGFVLGPLHAIAGTWLAIVFAALPGSVIRAVLRRAPPASAVALFCIVAGVGLAAAWSLGVWLGPRSHDILHTELSGTTPRCQLSGYSTTLNHNLMPGDPGIWELLADSCPACGGGATRRSRNSGDLEDIRRAVCDDVEAVGAPPLVVFYGGVNDDFTYGMNRQPVHVMFRAALSALRLFSTRTTIDFHGFRAAIEPCAAASLEHIAGQQQAIREAAACARARGGALWMFQDLFAMDLHGGRKGPRAEMLRLRREAVEAEGGYLVDVLEATRDVVGVSWFSDVMHLSAVGHRGVAELICLTLVNAADANDHLAPVHSPESSR